MLAQVRSVVKSEHHKTQVGGGLVHSVYIFSPHVSRGEEKLTQLSKCVFKRTPCLLHVIIRFINV